MTRLVASFGSLLVLAGVAAPAGLPAAPAPVPRYKFEPGQELTYRSTSTFKSGETKSAGERGRRTDWTVWVVRANQDGSFRLVIRQEDAFSYVMGGKKYEQARGRLVYADVFPDGRVLSNDTIKYQGHPGTIFPRVPKDAAETARGWSWEVDGDKVTAKPLKGGKGLRFETVTESPMNAIYLSSSKSTYSFDLAGGRVSAAETASTQGYGINGKWTGTTNLLAVKEADPTRGKQLAADDLRYFKSVMAYEKALDSAGLGGAEAAKKRLGAAVAALKAANKSVTHPMLKADLEGRIRGHNQAAKYRIAEAGRREKFVGRAAPEFDTKDLDGKAVKLSDLKGKVVVLDFWYRGCGWCIKAMPQMNGLAEDFKGKPVAIFGMNTDRDEADAKFVVEKMSLQYPTLKAIGLPEKFGVQAFPTLIVIDQKGKVHDLHVGYTPTLREDVGRQIKALLEKK